MTKSLDEWEKDAKKWEEEAIEAAPYLASDEKGSNFRDAVPAEVEDQAVNLDSTQRVKPWVHFVAGGVGGMAGAVVTCPFDLVKTRLQSDVYQSIYRSKATYNAGTMTQKTFNYVVQAGVHFKETFGILGNVYRQEGFTSLFKGLGPNLVGVIPARSINFFTYGTTKDIYSRYFNNGQEAAWIHLMAAATAGWTTSTATNPIWMIKTRLQLDKAGKRKQYKNSWDCIRSILRNEGIPGWTTSTATNPIWMIKTRLQLDKAGKRKQYKNSWDCIRSILRNEGIRGMYKGLSASYLGSVESILQWILYEQMKRVIKERSIEKFGYDEKHKGVSEKIKEWCQRSGSAGLAKFVASIITYPHEVVRTRLRQAPLENGKPKYTGLIQTFRVIIKEEGFISMYSGLTPHLMRTVPNSIIMFGTWELVIKLLS
ncbi:probable Mitochondrial carrier protein RIM2 [Zygosaccharomyces bailii ISA1307]|nr:probable Mitochondrial carrier protein RIM2 [Zygosaccharomyces bailii ISA1307]